MELSQRKCAMVNRFFISGTKKTLMHIIVSLAIHCSRRVCDINLNGLFLHCFAVCKNKLLTFQKILKEHWFERQRRKTKQSWWRVEPKNHFGCLARMLCPRLHDINHQLRCCVVTVNSLSTTDAYECIWASSLAYVAGVFSDKKRTDYIGH